MPIRRAPVRKAFLFSGCLLVVSAPFRFSTCYQPPPMVRFYAYSIPQKEVLVRCQTALQALGYTIESYTALDNHLVTKLRTVRYGLEKAHYVVFVKVEDRIGVFVYAETRVFRRGTELGLMAGDLTKLESSTLRLGFQGRIFEPITESFSREGFQEWSPPEIDVRDQRDIRGDQAPYRSMERDIREDYLFNRRLTRWEAVEEAEQFLRFVQDSVPPMTGVPTGRGWSLVSISRHMVPEDERLMKALLDILGAYPVYEGSGSIRVTIGPQGRVEGVWTRFDTSTGVPEEEVIHAINMHMRRLYFGPEMTRSGFAVVEREIRFQGHYHNADLQFTRPRLAKIVEQFPAVETETVVDTFFQKSR